MVPSLSYRQARELTDLPSLLGGHHEMPAEKSMISRYFKHGVKNYVRDQFFAKNGNNSKVSGHFVLKTSSDYDMRSECKHKLSHMLLHIDSSSGVTLYQGAPGSKFSKAPLVEVPKARVERRICTSFLGVQGMITRKMFESRLTEMPFP